MKLKKILNKMLNENLVKGTIFYAELPVFTGSFRNAKFSHNVKIKGIIEKESYGSDKGQHTFVFKVLESDDQKEYKIGSTYRKKGRSMYPNISKLEQPSDYEIQAADKAKRASTQSAKVKSKRDY